MHPGEEAAEAVSMAYIQLRPDFTNFSLKYVRFCEVDKNLMILLGFSSVSSVNTISDEGKQMLSASSEFFKKYGGGREHHQISEDFF